MFKKKASLNLSVQAIVIVVIAFVVLGLGLGFVRGQFEQMEATSTSVQEQISQQILDDLRTGNKRLSFPATQLTLETNELDVQAIGVKNTEDAQKSLEIQFSVMGYATEASGDEEFIPFISGQNTDWYTKDDAGNSQQVNAELIWDFSEQVFGQGDSEVFPVSITAPSKSGNYLFKIVLMDTADGLEFDSRTFFIKTT